MTLRLKTRLTLTITTLVLVVLSIVSLFTIITFTREQIRARYDLGDLISKQVYTQVKQANRSRSRSHPELHSRCLARRLGAAGTVRIDCR